MAWFMGEQVHSRAHSECESRISMQYFDKDSMLSRDAIGSETILEQLLICVYVYIYIHIYIYIYVCVYIYIYLCVCVRSTSRMYKANTNMEHTSKFLT